MQLARGVSWVLWITLLAGNAAGFQPLPLDAEMTDVPCAALHDSDSGMDHRVADDCLAHCLDAVTHNGDAALRAPSRTPADEEFEQDPKANCSPHSQLNAFTLDSAWQPPPALNVATRSPVRRYDRLLN